MMLFGGGREKRFGRLVVVSRSRGSLGGQKADIRSNIRRAFAMLGQWLDNDDTMENNALRTCRKVRKSMRRASPMETYQYPSLIASSKPTPGSSLIAGTVTPLNKVEVSSLEPLSLAPVTALLTIRFGAWSTAAPNDSCRRAATRAEAQVEGRISRTESPKGCQECLSPVVQSDFSVRRCSSLGGVFGFEI